jgi:hypothetical protein
MIKGAVALPSGAAGGRTNHTHDRRKELKWYEIQGGADATASSGVAVEGLCHD